MSRCSYCGGSAYGKPCVYSPNNIHLHEDATGCAYCGSSAYGKSCVHSPDKTHIHLGKKGCIYCGSVVLGSGCARNPNGRMHVHGSVIVVPTASKPNDPPSEREGSSMATVERSKRSNNFESRERFSRTGDGGDIWGATGLVAICIAVFLGAGCLYKAVGDFPYKPIWFAVGSLVTAFIAVVKGRDLVGKIIKFILFCLIALVLIAVAAWVFKHSHSGIQPTSATFAVQSPSLLSGFSQISGNAGPNSTLSQSNQQLYQVRGLGPDDLLNMRSGPGVNFPVVVKLRGDQTDIVLLDGVSVNGSTRWQRIMVSGQFGWVNSAFLGPSQ